MPMLPNPFKSTPDPREVLLMRLREGVPADLLGPLDMKDPEIAEAAREGAIKTFENLRDCGNATALLAAARRYELGSYRATVDVTGNATDPAGLQAARDDVARARAAREAAEERLRNAQA